MGKTELEERIGWRVEWRIDKFKDPEDVIAGALRNGLSMQEAIEKFKKSYLGSEIFDGNVALNEGLQYLIDIITGIQGTPTLWDNTNARVGVGNGIAAEDATQTGLQGTNTAFKGMDTGYPARSGQTAEWRGTFGSTEGNFAWEEFTVDNGATLDKNLNRKVTSKGTKVSGESWTLSLKITFS